MDEVKKKLGFLDDELARVKSQLAVLREEISAEIKASGKDEFKKEWYEISKAALFNRMISAGRRIDILEECRLSLVMNEVNYDDDGCGCDCNGDCDESLNQGLSEAVSGISRIVEHVTEQVNLEKAKAEKKNADPSAESV